MGYSSYTENQWMFNCSSGAHIYVEKCSGDLELTQSNMCDNKTAAYTVQTPPWNHFLQYTFIVICALN